MPPIPSRSWRAAMRLSTAAKIWNACRRRLSKRASASRCNFRTANLKHGWRIKTLMSDIQELSFEAAYAELETIIGKLESGELPLDESVDLYERGRKLS